MIQRIQSIYLFLAAVALILFNYLALGVDVKPDPDEIFYGNDHLPILIYSIVVAAISLLALFLFSNRQLQIKICRVNNLLIFGLIGLTIYYLFGNPDFNIESYGIGLVMPLFAMIFNILALKKIGDDEKLVQSMDRLR